jgi:hypothetical protein
MGQKQPKTSAPDNLTLEEAKQLIGWVKSKAHPVRGGIDPFFLKLAKNKRYIRHYVDKCLLYFREGKGMGTKRPGWLATVKEWLLNEAIYEEEKRTERGEKPQMTAPRGRVGSPVGDVIRDIETRELFEGE